MRKIVLTLLSLVLLFTLTACGENIDKLDGPGLKKRIDQILSSEKSEAQKGIELLPYLVSKAVTAESGSGNLLIAADFTDYMQDAVDLLNDIVAKKNIDDEQLKEFISGLNETIIKGKADEKQLHLYGYLLLKALGKLPKADLDKNPDKKIGKWDKDLIAEKKANATNYKKVIDKLAFDEVLLEKIPAALVTKDPLTAMALVMLTKDKNPNLVFSKELIKELAANPIHVLSYREFFDNPDKFFSCIPLEADLAMTLYLMDLKMNDQAKKNLSIYANVFPLAKTILESEFAAEFKEVFLDYRAYCEKNNLAPEAAEIIKSFPSINYSGISVEQLLAKPIEVSPATYIMAVAPSGNKDLNRKDDNFEILKKYFKSHSSLEEAPLEYAKYLVVVSYKKSKTNSYYKDNSKNAPDKKKYTIYNFSGTLTIYDRTSGEKVKTINFAKVKAPKKATWTEVFAHNSPNLNIVKEEFYTQLKSYISDLR